jgi:hypothetical protein
MYALLIGNKLWHIGGVLVLDLMQFRLDTGGHISHLAGAFFGFFYSITAKIDLSEIVTGVVSSGI